VSHFVVGDIQGCHAEFQQLLELIEYVKSLQSR